VREDNDRGAGGKAGDILAEPFQLLRADLAEPFQLGAVIEPDEMYALVKSGDPGVDVLPLE
jgi:hypothetical protein